MISNNPKLGGHLPGSLFEMPVLQDVIVEGVGLTGSLPSEICHAAQLSKLYVSGNQITGSLPKCITHLANMTEFSAASNLIEGTLPNLLHKMTSLVKLDLRSNYISGTLPHALGDMSRQLEVAKLDLNRLSCDLPHSVLNWKGTPHKKNLALLTGNLFSCPPTSGFNAIFGPALDDELPLHDLDEAGSTYQCGMQAWYSPLVQSGIVVLALTCAAQASNPAWSIALYAKRIWVKPAPE